MGALRVNATDVLPTNLLTSVQGNDAYTKRKRVVAVGQGAQSSSRNGWRRVPIIPETGMSTRHAVAS